MQLKGRLTFGRKYLGKDLYIAFEQGGTWYLYPHDELLERVMRETNTISNTASWEGQGGYSFNSLSEQLKQLLEPHKIAGRDLRVSD